MSGVRIIMWDWRGQPDIEQLNEAVRAVFDGANCPQIVAVPDTGCDSYAVAVSATPLAPEETQAAYGAWWLEVTA